MCVYIYIYIYICPPLGVISLAAPRHIGIVLEAPIPGVFMYPRSSPK